MAAAFSIHDRNIILTPFFEGSNTFKGGIEHGGLAALVVDLIVRGLSTKISVSIPEHTNSGDEPKKLKFSCIRGGVSTCPDSLRLSIDQIKNLAIRVGTFEKGRPIGPKIMDTRTGEVSQQQTLIRDDVIISLKLPESLEPYQRYRFIVSSEDFVFSARMEKEGASAASGGGGGKGEADDYRQKMRKIVDAVVEEEVRNLKQILSGVFGNDSAAEVATHVTNEVIQAGRELIPDPVIPNTNIAQKPADLNRLSVEELEKRFEADFTQDKKSKEI